MKLQAYQGNVILDESNDIVATINFSSFPYTSTELRNELVKRFNTHERMKEMLEKIVADAELSNILRNCYVSITIINQARSLLSELKEGQ